MNYAVTHTDCTYDMCQVKLIVFNFYAFKSSNVITFYCAIDISPFCSFETFCAWRVLPLYWYRKRVIDENRYMLRGRFLELSNNWVVLVIILCNNMALRLISD